MAKTSKSILFGYLKCPDLATKFTNLLDSFWHKDEKIPKSALADDAMVEIVDNVISTDADKALSAKQGKTLKDQQDVNFENIATNEQAIADNGVSIVGLENNKSNKVNTVNLDEPQQINVLKTFKYDKLGFRNFANTFTSFLRNSNTATRYYTFQNRNGVIADDTDLETKQNKFSGLANYIVKSISEFEIGRSTLIDVAGFFGFNTVFSPSKDITLGNQMNKEIGIEESSAIEVGRDLTISAGRTNDYIVDSQFNTVNSGLNFISMSSAPNGDVYGVLSNDDIVKRLDGETNFTVINNSKTFLGNDKISERTYIYVSDNGTVYLIYSWWTVNGGLWVKNLNDDLFTKVEYFNSMVSMTETSNGDFYLAGIGASSRGWAWRKLSTESTFTRLNSIESEFNLQSSDTVIITSDVNDDIYFAIPNKGIFKQVNGVGEFINQQAGVLNWSGIHCADNGNVYASVLNGDLYIQYQGLGAFIALNQTTRNWNGLSSDSENNIYAIANELYFLSNSNKGLPNLDGGTLKLKAGTGKGEGQSRVEFITGNKLASGTDMQPEVVRGYIDENGYFIYNYPSFPDNTAALAGGLPHNAVYKDNNGILKSVIIAQQ